MMSPLVTRRHLSVLSRSAGFTIGVVILVQFLLMKYAYMPRLEPEWLNTSVYDPSKPYRLLIVGILSKPSALERREAIRQTWMLECNKIAHMHCVFFTDAPDSTESNTYSSSINEEVANAKDMVALPVKAGLNFSLRLLKMYQWAADSFNFDFFLRVDDDYFLCIEHLHYDILHRPTTGLYWGYVHCFTRIIRVDEGWMILSSDIVKEILFRRNWSLLCHPFGDQAAAMWIQTSRLSITYFNDNERVIHDDTFKNPERYMRHNICEVVLGLHGTSPDKMRSYWNLTSVTKVNQNDLVVPKIRPFKETCSHSIMFDWERFLPAYRYEPLPCRIEPVWYSKKREYAGRGI